MILWVNHKPYAWVLMALVGAGTFIYPAVFLSLSILTLVYLISLVIWLRVHEQKSKKLGLKVITLLPCERWLFQKLAHRKGIYIPPLSKVLEMHINTSVIYRGCEENIDCFKNDLESDLKTIERLLNTGTIARERVLTLNTFNQFWTKKTLEIMGGTMYRGTVLSKVICTLYTPRKHKKIFTRMFPGCRLINPGRNNPQKWDLTIIERS